MQRPCYYESELNERLLTGLYCLYYELFSSPNFSCKVIYLCLFTVNGFDNFLVVLVFWNDLGKSMYFRSEKCYKNNLA